MACSRFYAMLNLIGYRSTIALFVTLLASCSTTAPAPGASETADIPGPNGQTTTDHVLWELVERIQRKALVLMQQEQWFEAAIQWEVLQLLLPNNSDYSQKIEECLIRRDSLVSNYNKTANEANKKRDFELSKISYLKILSLNPDNQTAIQELRKLEAIKASKNISLRPYPVAITNHDSSKKSANHQTAPYSGTRQELDLGIMLFKQRDFAASIATLERYLLTDRQDKEANRYLFDAYQLLAHQQLRSANHEEALGNLERAQKMMPQQSTTDLLVTIKSLRNKIAEDSYQLGVRIYFSDIAKAITLWERSLQFDPSHKQASIRLAQARKMQQTLKSIPGKSQH